MLTENTIKYKQILIDIDNYNALKELGKTGDSFNDVIKGLLDATAYRPQNSSIECADERLIEIGPNGKSFILKIDSGLRKVQVNHITCFKDYLKIEFLDENTVNVDYPTDLLKIPEEVESGLLNSGLRFPNYAVKRIVGHFQKHVYILQRCIKDLT